MNQIELQILVKELSLEHVVITSVDRDDLEDGGAHHFAEVINSIKRISVKILQLKFLHLIF